MTTHDLGRSATIDALPYDECIALLRRHSVGRIAVMAHDFPLVLPINYRLIEACGMNWIAVRTRPTNTIERAPLPVAFEIDSFDERDHVGWSVLVRGTLHHVDPDAAGFRERFDPAPWPDTDRTAWLAIQPFAITGRQLHRAALWFEDAETPSGLERPLEHR